VQLTDFHVLSAAHN